MTVPLLTNPGGLFRRLGTLARFLKDVNAAQATTYPADIAAVVAQYVYTGGSVASKPDLSATLQTQALALPGGMTSAASIVQSMARATLLAMVNDDTRQRQSSSLSAALGVLIAQMQAAGQSVAKCNVTVVPTPGTLVGNGALYTTAKGPDALDRQNLFAETGALACTRDGTTGAAAGNETFTFSGQATDPNGVLGWTWPAGSGVAATVKAVDGSRDNTTGNLLTNSDFENWTGNAPNSWTIADGVAGTDVKKSTAGPYTGAACLQLPGGLLTTTLTQQFASATQTRGKLAPLTTYAVNLWAKVSSVPAAGVLAVELCNANGDILLDAQGNQQAITVGAPGLSSSWAAFGGFFRTPATLPAATMLRLRLSTPLSLGVSLFVDRLALAGATDLYPGGPSVAMFSGATPFALNDSWTLAMSNDRAGTSYNATFQSFFDRVFGMRALGLQLPFAVSPTVSDSLIG